MFQTLLMSSVSATCQIYELSPAELWDQFAGRPNLFLPASIDKFSFGHYQEITGKRHGFQLKPRWEAFPQGPWSILLETAERKPTEKIAYHVSIDREKGLLYTGVLTITLDTIESGTDLLVKIDGQREAELAEYTDEMVETVLRSLIREGIDALNASVSGEADHERLAPSCEYENEEDHMAPLAVAAGVFSAGMAVSLWLWRRKKRKQSD